MKTTSVHSAQIKIPVIGHTCQQLGFFLIFLAFLNSGDQLRLFRKLIVQGLDCSAENNAGPANKIYNIDRQDVIDVRNELIPPAENVTNIGSDLNDTVWFDAIDDSDGVIFFAAGVFYYFLAEEVRKLFTVMAKRFPGGRLVFDTANRRAVKMMLKTWVKTAGITDVEKYFYVNDVQDLGAWLPQAKISAKGYMLGYSDLKIPSVSGFFRFLSKVGDGYMKMRIVRIDF